MMSTRRIIGMIIRAGLFALILSVGTMVALILDETEGLALTDLPEATILTVANAPQSEVMVAELTAGPQMSGIYRSEDSGHTWRIVGSGMNTPINALAVHPQDDAVLYAGTAGGPLGPTNNVWRSDDGGQSWHNFNLSLPASPDRVVPDVTTVVPDPTRPGVLYVGTDGQGVYRFDEAGLGYELVGGLDLYNSHIKQLTVASNGQLYAVTNGGFYVTNGDTWQKIETLPEAAITVAVAPSDPSVLYVGSASSGLYCSTDGGQTWENMSAGLGMVPGAALRVTALSVDDQDANHIAVSTAYGLGNQLAGGGIFESIDGGRHWNKLDEMDTPVKLLTLKRSEVQAVMANGTVRYGSAEEPSSPVSLPSLRPLASPSGIQILVLLATLGLAILVVVSHLGWVAENRQTGAYVKKDVTK